MADNTAPTPPAAPPSNTANGTLPTPNTAKPMTFDQALSDDLGAQSINPMDAPKEKKASVPMGEEQDDDIQDDLDDDEAEDSDDDEDDAEEDDTEEGEEAASEEEQEPEEESDQEEAPTDVISDEELDKKLRVKIDGKWEERSLKEWRNVIASGAHNQKIYRAWESQKELDVRAINEAKAQLGIANAKITPAWEKIKAKDVEGSIYELASTAGFNKLEVARRLRDQMLPAIAQRLGLTSDEVRQRLTQMEPHNRALDIQERNEFLESENKRIQEASKPREPDAVALEEQRIHGMMVEHGISRSDLKWAYEWLHKQAPEGMKPTISVEVLQNTIINRRFVEKVFDAIESRRPSLAKDSRFVDRTIRKLKKNPDWSVSRLASWVEKQARVASVEQKQTKVNELTRDVSRKALKTRGKDGFQNPDVGQKRAMRFNDLMDDDQSGSLM